MMLEARGLHVPGSAAFCTLAAERKMFSNWRRFVMSRFIISIAVICMMAAGAWAQEPIAELDLLPEQGRLQASAWNKPIVITSMQEAGGLFKNAASGVLGSQVDFEKQFLLVFAWQGSGGDRLSYTVAESFPEQIFFSMKRGLTRDLRPHVHVYALRSNVRWSIQDEGTTGRATPAAEPQKFLEPGSMAWMQEVDRRAGGCGPGIGSAAWMQAVALKLGVYDGQGHGPDPGSEEWLYAIHRKAFGSEPEIRVRAVYVSAEGEKLSVVYDHLRKTVTLTAPDGEVTLPQAISASGARYTADEHEVFWNKGANASYWKNGTLLFEGVEMPGPGKDLTQ
jgi:Membrane-bound lysozyme-inhibitor of c-type lysozyme